MSAGPTIRKLDESVINRIAAGEVIQRPANALKELLENSLDAGSTNIQVTVKQGGLKYLQIQDNGCGIRKEDLGIVCERFTTSKLTNFEDLTKISTYGFRGEALASISHVAHLTIVTKTEGSQVGYKASYEDSKPKGPPKPCAAPQGTQITVEDLFYNIPTRRKAFSNFNEEHAKISNVVSKYSIHNSTVGFSLKKQGESTSDVKTPPNSSPQENIRIIYGNAIAKELLEVKSQDDLLKFKLTGYISNVNYSTKKLLFLLFINNRLVDSTGIKKIIEQTYNVYLPKNSHPFVYLSIHLDPQTIDVNVHPTKYEVHFLHEESIIEKIKIVLENTLLGSNNSRIVYTQAKLPISFTNNVSIEPKTQQEKKVYAHSLVRTDSTEQKLDKFFEPNRTVQEEEKDTEDYGKREKREIKLRSILQLRADVENSTHKGLSEVTRNFHFVGVVSPSQCLLQHDTKLYLCNTEKLTEELIYQTLLFEFGNFGVIRFSSPISIEDLAKLYLEKENSKCLETEEPIEDVIKTMKELLIERSPMLDDYFSIEIDKQGNICSLPLILDKYMPNVGYLPQFLVRVCTEVDWQLEKPCLGGICRELAKFYSKLNLKDDDDSGDLVDSDWKWVTEHILLSAVKISLLPPGSFAQDGTVLQIANLTDLYKVFERC